MNEFGQYLSCPVCEARLTGTGATVRCAQAHAFDVAREGYINLLLANRKQPATVGDTKEMLQARRRFLERGYYQPLLEAINRQVYAYLNQPPTAPAEAIPAGVAEIGCGEGYYIGRLKRFLDGQPEQRLNCFFGVDISKAAVRYAAKQYQDVHFILADVRQKIYFANGALGVLLNIFAPRNAAEFGRIMAPQGLLLIVIPNASHLLNLRTDLNLLSIEAHKQPRVIEQLSDRFKLAGEQSVEYDLRLDNQALLDLIQMTPNYRHLSEETLARLQDTESMLTQASFTILEFSRS